MREYHKSKGHKEKRGNNDNFFRVGFEDVFSEAYKSGNDENSQADKRCPCGVKSCVIH